MITLIQSRCSKQRNTTIPSLEQAGFLVFLMQEHGQRAEGLVTWYNTKHLHSALKFVTPHQRHSGEDVAIRVKRQVIYELAKAKHPERWSGETRDWVVRKVSTLNPNKKQKEQRSESIVH